MVPARAARAEGLAGARTTTSGATPTTKYAGTRIIFIDTEKSNWTFDPVAGQYYWHRFFSHQPDLNFDNPHVLEAVIDVMRFWLDLGVDALAPGRHPVSDRARRDDQREPAGNARRC